MTNDLAAYPYPKPIPVPQATGPIAQDQIADDPQVVVTALAMLLAQELAKYDVVVRRRLVSVFVAVLTTEVQGYDRAWTTAVQSAMQDYAGALRG